MDNSQIEKMQEMNRELADSGVIFRHFDDKRAYGWENQNYSRYGFETFDEAYCDCVKMAFGSGNPKYY